MRFIKKQAICFIVLTFCINLPTFGQTWVWRYKKLLTHTEREENKVRSALLFGKLGIESFSQLIFAWNAFRPERGYFRFFTQVRDSVTGNWHDWHHMIEWGAQAQRSFFNESATGTKYHHVRLELPPRKSADAFRIRVEAHEGADLSLLCGLYVTVAHYPSFLSEKIEQLKLLPSVKVVGVPSQSQMVLDHPKKEVLCSPTSCSMVSSFLTGKKIDPVFFASKAYDAGLDAYGSWPFNTVHVFEKSQGEVLFYVTRLNSFAEIHRSLEKNLPVIVSVRGNIDGAPQEYKNGHLLVIVGWDSAREKVICHDPAFSVSEKTVVSYPLLSFIAAWEKSRRLTYLAEISPIAFVPH
jgi:hypothetical protein